MPKRKGTARTAKASESRHAERHEREARQQSRLEDVELSPGAVLI
jgi:hypothetical protein